MDLQAWMQRAREIAAYWNGANLNDQAQEEWAEELALAYYIALQPQNTVEAAARVGEFARRLPDGLVVALCQNNQVRGRRRRRMK